MQKNEYWLSYLLDSEIEHKNPDRIFTMADEIKRIKVQEVQKLAKDYLTQQNLFEFVQYPEF